MLSLTPMITQFIKRSCKSRKETPQKLTQLSSRSHPRHLVGNRTAQKDITIDTTSDSQVNSNFPYRWSPASLTFNNYFYLFLYLYITWITTNNNAPHLKSPKNQSRRAALGRPAIKNTGGLELVCGRPTIFSRHFWKSICTGNLYLGPFAIIERILESEIIFRLPVITWPAAG